MGFISPLSLLNWSWQNNRDTLIPQRKSWQVQLGWPSKNDLILSGILSHTLQGFREWCCYFWAAASEPTQAHSAWMCVCGCVCYGWSTSLFLVSWFHTALERGFTGTAPLMNPYKLNEAGLKITALSLHINKHQLEMEWASLCLQGEDWAVSLMYTRRTSSVRNHDLWSVSCGGVNLTSLLNVFLSNIA